MIATAAGVEGVAQPAEGRRVVVVGAGAFGGWTALELRRRGARVTLVDAWGPGNARASSGGETRVIRATYGARSIYTRMAVRAMALWRAHDAKWERGFFRKTGALWMLGQDAFGAADAFGRASAAALRAEKLPIEELTPQAAATRFPQIAFDDTVKSVLWEPEAGYLFARRACEHVLERFIAEGGEYRQSAVPAPVSIDAAPLRRLTLTDGTAIEADAFVFACGPWLGTALSRRGGEARHADPPGGLLLRHPAGRPAVSRSVDAGVGRLPGAIDLRHPGQREPRLQGRGRHAGPVVRSDDGSRDATPAGSRPRARS
jgi:glycine/D-amino acid oxidase-like deaminating enzyme